MTDSCWSRRRPLQPSWMLLLLWLLLLLLSWHILQ
jgi:hypothetical protein